VTRARTSSRCVKIDTCSPPSIASSSAPRMRVASVLACAKGTTLSAVPCTINVGVAMRSSGYSVERV
jgi:hypothetical protein